MYVVVSFRTLRVQMKMYMATQLDINPSTNTILNMHPYKVYLKESSQKHWELLLLTIIKARSAYCIEVLWSAAGSFDIQILTTLKPPVYLQILWIFGWFYKYFLFVQNLQKKHEMKFVAVKFALGSSTGKWSHFLVSRKSLNPGLVRRRATFKKCSQ